MPFRFTFVTGGFLCGALAFLPHWLLFFFYDGPSVRQQQLDFACSHRLAVVLSNISIFGEYHNISLEIILYCVYLNIILCYLLFLCM